LARGEGACSGPSGMNGRHGLVEVLLLGAIALGCSNMPARSVPTTGFCSPGYQQQFGWPDPVMAARVCHCESSGNPRAVSPNGRYAGLFQFSEATWNEMGGGAVFDPEQNSRRALQLFQRRGWKPWPSCSR
jgi:Transglycosylase-like domain